MKYVLFCLLALRAIEASAAPIRSTDWPQWRGPNRNGITASDQIWPSSLADEVLKKRWSAELGPSYSGPIVLGDAVFTTETVAKRTERVTAFDRNTGQKRWTAQWPGAMTVPFFAARNGSWIRSTPATDGQYLFVGGMRDVLVCLEVKTGKEIWRSDFVQACKTPLPAFGMVSSPLLDNEAVYVQAGAAFCKLDKLTGKLIWRTAADEGGMYGSAFASPVRANVAGHDLLIVQTRAALLLIDPKTGAIQAEKKIKAFRGMNILTPTIAGDSVFTSAYGGKSHLFAISQNQGKLAIEEQWQSKQQGYMSSPLVIDRVIYLHSRSQRLHALDLQTGAELWDQSNRFGKYWSMISNGRKILSLDENGTLRLFKPNRDRYEELDSRPIARNSWAHIAISNRQVFIREIDRLTVFDWNDGARPSARGAR